MRNSGASAPFCSVMTGMASHRRCGWSWASVVCALLAALGASLVLIGHAVARTPRGPDLRCGTRLPVLVREAWSAARRVLVPAGPVEVEFCTFGRDHVQIGSYGFAPVIAREFDAIPRSTPVATCKSGTGVQVLADFGYASGRSVSVITDLGPCALVSNGNVHRRATGRFAHLLLDLRHFARIPPPPLSPAPVLARGTPGCTRATAPQPRLSGVATAFTQLGGAPFGIAAAPDLPFAFVASARGTDVMSTATFAPTLVRQITPEHGAFGLGPAGDAISPNGHDLLIADGTGAIVIDVGRAEAGAPDPILGALSIDDQLAVGPIEVAFSPDSRYAFVSVEYSDEIAVFNLRAAIAQDFRSSALVGTIPLGEAVDGIAVSPDGRWIYATSESADGRPVGVLSVIDLNAAETDPEHAVRVNITAGCGPVRVAVSPDGTTVWVTARESDALLGYSVVSLLSDPSHALIANVRVGEAPVGLALIHDGGEIVTADSDRFLVPGASAQLTVVNTAAALDGQPAIVGSLPSGLFPRDETLAPDGTLLVTNYSSGQLEAVNTTAIPQAATPET